MAKSNPQLSAATALVQLLTERPDLSERMSWSVTRTSPVLVGFIHAGGAETLADCARFLDGVVRDGGTFERGDSPVRQHVLSATWRDVPVEVLVSLPVAVEAVAA